MNEVRRCPHCGLVWTKIEGCNGNTICGERPTSGNDARNPSFLEMATFGFDFRNGPLRIWKSGSRQAQRIQSGSGRRVGCGRTINWSNMASVPLPPEFSHQPVVSSTKINAFLSWH